jgi:hypothetical protein
MHSPVVITNKLARRSFRRHENRPGSNQENIPPILKLPPEVLDRCWGYLSRVDLLQMPHVCRIFWYTSRSRIFKSLRIRLLPGSPAAAVFRRCAGFLFRKTLTNTAIRIPSFYSDPSARELWDMVQICTLSVARLGSWVVDGRSRKSTYVPDQSWQDFEQRLALASFDPVFLSRSCNLRRLTFHFMDLGREHWVAQQPAPEALALPECSFLSSPHFQRSLKLKELIIDGSHSYHAIDNHLLYVLCNPAHLEKLILDDHHATETIYTVLSGLLSMGQFPRLTYLNILVESQSCSHFFRFLGAIPSLTTLILRTSVRSGRVIPSHPLPALSSFQSYDGHPQLISHIVPGRPVETVRLVPKVSRDGQLCDGDTSSDFASVVLDISRSSVPVTTLRIQYFMPTLSRLATIADHLPDLHLLDLNLVPISPPHTLVSGTPTCLNLPTSHYLHRKI